MQKNTAHITIDLDDVVANGGVAGALSAWCERSDTTACGVIGPAFATSGPGSGWSMEYDEDDFARRAIEEGAVCYLDLDNGRLIEAEEVDVSEKDEAGEWPDDVIHDLGGGHVRLGDWSDESCVRIECPDIEYAIEHPREVAEMAQAIIDYHAAESDTAAWKKLIVAIRYLAEAVEDIDIDQLG